MTVPRDTPLLAVGLFIVFAHESFYFFNYKAMLIFNQLIKQGKRKIFSQKKMVIFFVYAYMGESYYNS